MPTPHPTSLSSTRRRKRPRPTARDRDIDRELCPQKRFVLTVYLRDYYSQYHQPGSGSVHWHFLYRHSKTKVDVTEQFQYWNRVETGELRVWSNLHDCIATTLSWPRTYMLLHSRHIASLTTVPRTNTLNYDATGWTWTSLLCLYLHIVGASHSRIGNAGKETSFVICPNCSLWICQSAINQRSVMEHFVISRV